MITVAFTVFHLVIAILSGNTAITTWEESRVHSLVFLLISLGAAYFAFRNIFTLVKKKPEVEERKLISPAPEEKKKC